MRVLFATKFLRTFAFGALSVVLAMWLTKQGMSSVEVGGLLTATMITDAVATVAVARLVPRVGSRWLLILSAVAMAGCSSVLLVAHTKLAMLLAVVLGIVSPSGYEGGAFAAIEQGLIGEEGESEEKLARDLSHYNLSGFAGAGIGAFAAGAVLSALGEMGGAQVVFGGYTCVSLVMACLYARARFAKSQSRFCSSSPLPRKESGTETAAPITADLAWMAGLQGLDAFAGGLIVQSMLVYWFVAHLNCSAEYIGGIIFWTNVFAAASFIYTPILAKRIGLLRVMVFTHLPCSLSLCLLPFLPNAAWAGALLIVRSFFSSMDIPVRQAYTMLLVPPSQRPFANSVVTGTRTLTQSLGPSLSGIAFANAFTAAPFVVAGILKSCYDIGAFIRFRSKRLPAETQIPSSVSTPNTSEKRVAVSSRS